MINAVNLSKNLQKTSHKPFDTHQFYVTSSIPKDTPEYCFLDVYSKIEVFSLKGSLLRANAILLGHLLTMNGPICPFDAWICPLMLGFGWNCSYFITMHVKSNYLQVIFLY